MVVVWLLCCGRLSARSAGAWSKRLSCVAVYECCDRRNVLIIGCETATWLFVCGVVLLARLYHRYCVDWLLANQRLELLMCTNYPFVLVIIINIPVAARSY